MSALVVVLAGCVDTPSQTAGTGEPTADSRSIYTQDAIAYARCVRSHGVPGFPDPNSDGTFPKARIPAGSGAQLTGANRTCGHLLPANGSGYVVTAKEQQDYLNAAACMRSHGISNFPDPVFSEGYGKVNFPIPSSISTTSTQFTTARATCAKLIPAGLPYSAPAG
ncbi:MAG TPA: hypothetical protein VHX87_04830 [Galbitalea sp.]|jgi:hypothetical protein|nr:hypothetical protein [Galbitalea sp.]